MKTADAPLVSIVTPVYNGSQYLEELIVSVKNQGYPNIEHLVIDDGSQDNKSTMSILKKYSHLKWWSRENKGQYATMNEGLSMAKGEYVCFVSADDVITADAIQKSVGFLLKYSLFDGVFGTTTYIDSNGENLLYPVPFQHVPIALVAYFAHIPHCSLYIKKSSLLKNKLLFNVSLKYVGDYDWMIRIHKSGLRIGHINDTLSKVRIHPKQTSQRHEKESSKEFHQVLKHNQVNRLYFNLLRTIYIFTFRILKVFILYSSQGFKGVSTIIKKCLYKTNP